MNPRGRPEPGGTPLVWGLLVIAAAVVGGLAAAALVHTSLVVAIIVAIIVGVIAVAVFRSPAAPPGRLTSERPTTERPIQERPASGQASFADPRLRPAAPAAPAPAPSAAPPAPDPAGPVVQVLPLQTPNQAGASWWDAAAGAPPPPSRTARLAPAPDLSTYLASTFIAQCPACGAFRLDSRRTPDGWDFRCESCEYSWAWQPGTPWPPVRVRPARRRGSRPPAP